MQRRTLENLLVEQKRLAALRAHVSLLFSQSVSIPALLQACATALVHHLDIALARIWLLDNAGKVLELQAGAGAYTHRDGFHDRIPIGHGRIGQIAQHGQPDFSDTMLGDASLSDQAWAREEGLISFAGVPLLIDDQVLGVLACFSNAPLSIAVREALVAEAHAIALGVDHKRTVSTLQKREAYFRSLIENALDVVCILNSDGTIRYASPSFTRVLGWTPEDLLDRSVFTLVHEDNIASSLATFTEVVLRPEKIETIEVRCQHKDGSWRYLEVTGKSLLDAPDVAGVILNAHDITDRNRMLQELAESRMQMTQAAKLTELGEMATGIAHEINQPLTTIKMGADLLLRDLRASRTPDPAKLHPILEKISSQVERATTIINHMRALGHPPTNIRAPLNMNEVLLSALGLLEYRLKAHDITVQIALEERLPLIFAEQIPLEQVLIALINNARDAMDEEGQKRQELRLPYSKRLELYTTLEDGQVTVSVSDNGPGIAPEIQQRIFEPFFTTKKVGKGTGLGLAVSYRIVQQYGGLLAISRSPRGGATFRLQFPPLNRERVESAS